jgi:hypothetical protein
MLAAYRKTIENELITQHSGTHEGVFQMQLVDTVHEGQIYGIYLPGQVINATPAYTHQLRLPFY